MREKKSKMAQRLVADERSARYLGAGGTKRKSTRFRTPHSPIILRRWHNLLHFAVLWCLCSIVRGVGARQAEKNIIIWPSEEDEPLLTIFLDTDLDSVTLATQFQGRLAYQVSSGGSETGVDGLSAVFTTTEGQRTARADQITKNIVKLTEKGALELQEGPETKLREEHSGQWLLSLSTKETQLLTLQISIVPGCQLPQDLITWQGTRSGKDHEAPLWLSQPSDWLSLGPNSTLKANFEATTSGFPNCGNYNLEKLSEIQFVSDADILNNGTLDVSMDHTMVRLELLGETREVLQPARVTAIGTFGPESAKVVIFTQELTLIDCLRTVSLNPENIESSSLLDHVTGELALDFDFYPDTIDKEGRTFIKPVLQPNTTSLATNPGLEVQGDTCLARMLLETTAHCQVHIFDEATQLEISVPFAEDGKEVGSKSTYQTTEYLHLGADAFQDGAQSLLIYTHCQLVGQGAPFIRETALTPIKSQAKPLISKKSQSLTSLALGGQSREQVRQRRLLQAISSCNPDWPDTGSFNGFRKISVEYPTNGSCSGFVFDYDFYYESGYFAEMYSNQYAKFQVLDWRPWGQGEESVDLTFSFKDTDGTVVAQKRYTITAVEYWVYNNNNEIVSQKSVDFAVDGEDWANVQDVEVWSYTAVASSHQFEELYLSRQNDHWNAHLLTIKKDDATTAEFVEMSVSEYKVDNGFPDYFTVSGFDDSTTPVVQIASMLPNEAVGTYYVTWELRYASGSSSQSPLIKSKTTKIIILDSCRADYLYVEEEGNVANASPTTYEGMTVFTSHTDHIKYRHEVSNTFENSIIYKNTDVSHICGNIGIQVTATQAFAAVNAGIYFTGVNSYGLLEWVPDFTWPDVAGGETAVTIKFTTTVAPAQNPTFISYITLNGDDCDQTILTTDDNFGRTFTFKQEMNPTFNIDYPFVKNSVEAAGLCTDFLTQTLTITRNGGTVETFSGPSSAPISFSSTDETVTIEVSATWSFRDVAGAYTSEQMVFTKADSFCEVSDYIEIVVEEGQDIYSQEIAIDYMEAQWTYNVDSYVSYEFKEVPALPFHSSNGIFSFEELDYTAFNVGDPFACSGSVKEVTGTCPSASQSLIGTVIDGEHELQYTSSLTNVVIVGLTGTVYSKCSYKNDWVQGVQSPIFELSIFHDMNVAQALPTRMAVDPVTDIIHTLKLKRADEDWSTDPDDDLPSEDLPENYTVQNSVQDQLMLTVSEANKPMFTLLSTATRRASYVFFWSVQNTGVNGWIDEEQWTFTVTDSCDSIQIGSDPQDGIISTTITLPATSYSLFDPLMYIYLGESYPVGVGNGPCPGTFTYTLTSDLYEDVGICDADSGEIKVLDESYAEVDLEYISDYIHWNDQTGIVSAVAEIPDVSGGETAVELYLTFDLTITLEDSVNEAGQVSPLSPITITPFESWAHLGGDECSQDLQTLIPISEDSMPTQSIKVTEEMLPATLTFGKIFEQVNPEKGLCFYRWEAIQYSEISDFTDCETIVKDSLDDEIDFELSDKMASTGDLYVRFQSRYKEKGNTESSKTFLYFTYNPTPVCGRGSITMTLSETEVGIYAEQGVPSDPQTFELEPTYTIHEEIKLFTPDAEDLRVTFGADSKTFELGSTTDCDGALVDESSQPLSFKCADWTMALSLEETTWHDQTVKNAQFPILEAPISLNCTYAKCSNLVDNLQNSYSDHWQVHPFGESVRNDLGTQILYLTEDQVMIFLPDIVPWCEGQVIETTIYAQITDANGVEQGLNGSEAELSLFDVALTKTKTGFFFIVESENFDLMDCRLSVQIEAGVDFDLDYEFRNTTTFDIFYKRPPCPITQQEVDAKFAALGTTIPLSTSYISKAIKNIEPYRAAVLEFEQTVPFIAELCGELVTQFSNSHSFVSFDDENGLVNLAPNINIEQKFYKSQLSFSYPLNEGVAAVIEFVFEVKPCLVQRISFKSRFVVASYTIGAAPMDVSLPSVVQSPSCNYPVLSYRIGDEVISEADHGIVKSAASLSSATVVIESTDFALLDSQATYLVYADIKDEYKADKGFTEVPFQVRTVFPSVDLQIDVDSQVIPVITCSPSDATWHAKLTVSPSLGTVQITHNIESDESGLFSFDSDTKTISLSPTARPSIITGGDKCPVTSPVEFPIKLTSANLGTAYQLIPIRVVKSTLEFKLNEKDANINQISLKIDSVEMSVDGKLKIRFNKKFIAPQINMYEEDGLTLLDDSKRRRIQTAATTTEDSSVFNYEISDLVSVEVDTEYTEESLNKGIESIALIELTEQSLTIKVLFEELKDITPSIVEPDELKIKFTIPELIVAAATFETLTESDVPFVIQIQPQMSSEELENFLTAQAAAAVVGGAVAIWQLILFCFFGKTINAMWTLINALQFFVYITMWQIQFPTSLQIVVGEIRRLTLGEYLEDLNVQVVTEIKDIFGIQTGESGSTGSQTGISRLGSSNIMDNLGVTLVVISVILLLLVLLIYCCRQCAKRCSFSVKNKERIKNLKGKIFYGPMLRYSLLQCLKLNVTFLLPVLGTRGHLAHTIAMSLVFVTFGALPFFYKRLLFKRRADLDDEVNVNKFGVLYKTLKIEKFTGKGSTESGDSKLGSETQIVQSQFVFDDIPMDQQDMKLPRPPEKEYHSFWLYYQPVFMVRRSLFAIVTVALFDYPNMQMMLHQLLGMVTMAFLTQTVFQSRFQKWIEIGSEFMLLVCSTILQQYLRVLSEQAQATAMVAFNAALGLLLLINVAFMVYMNVQGCKEKKHLKHLMQLKEEAYQKAVIRHQEQLRRKQIIEAKKAERKWLRQERIKLQRERAQAARNAALEEAEQRQRELREMQERYPNATICDESIFDEPSPRQPGMGPPQPAIAYCKESAIPHYQELARKNNWELRAVINPSTTMIRTDQDGSSHDLSTKYSQQSSRSGGRRQKPKQQPSKILAKAEQLMKESDQQKAREERQRAIANDTRTELQKELERMNALRGPAPPLHPIPSHHNQRRPDPQNPFTAGYNGTMSQRQKPLNSLEQAILEVEQMNERRTRQELAVIKEVEEDQDLVKRAERELLRATQHRQLQPPYKNLHQSTRR